jgi:Methyltransferase domain
MDLKEIGKVDPDNFWYYLYKGQFIFDKAIKSFNKSEILFDVGAGSGYFASIFVKNKKTIKAYCIDPFYSKDQLGNRNNLNFVTAPPSEKADVLLFIDVLEHVEDDLALLKSYISSSSADALFVISVPAFKSLWSNHDVFLEHFRRYRKKDLRSLIKRAGLVEVESSYIFGSIFPLVWLIRKLKRSKTIQSDLKRSSNFVNFLILNFLKIEKVLPINRLFGTSVFISAKKY